MKDIQITRFARSILVATLLGSVATISGCATTTRGEGKAKPRVIEDMPALEALPADSRPVIKVSLKQGGSYDVPESARWIFALANRDSSVASGSNLETKLIDSLLASNRFFVRTNDTIDLQQEKALQDSGDLREDSGVRRGRMYKAQYAIVANVVDMNFAEEESSGRWSIPIPFVGRQTFGRGEKVATITIVAQITNVETGLHIQSVTAHGYQTSATSNNNFSFRGIHFDSSEKKNPTLANAITECIADLVYQIGEAIPPNSVGAGSEPEKETPIIEASTGAFCSNCGAKRSGGGKFCSGCGSGFGS